MTAFLARPRAAAWLVRAALAIKEFARPLDANERASIDPRLSMPPCVWHGRAVFGFYVAPSRSSKKDEQGRPADEHR